MFQSYNPYTLKATKNYSLTTKKDLDDTLSKSKDSFLQWRNLSVPHRCEQVKKLGDLLRKKKEAAALLITQEMGKPISQSRSEIDKCADLCSFYAANAVAYLSNKSTETDFESYVTFDPLGVILGIMPWNFPFWQVFRFAIPTLLAGNTVLLKHASNVPQCALFIESLCNEVFEIPYVYQNIFLENSTTEGLIANPIIKGVSLTGSTKAGRAVASMAGKYLKPVILELGGSNALIVCQDAAIDKAVIACVKGRFSNNGQSCIAVKRLLLQDSIKDLFITKLFRELDKLKIGDPTKEDTFFSVLALPKFADELKKIVENSVANGAQIIYGGTSKKAYFEPTVVTNVTANMPLFTKETFGPVLPITTFNTLEEAISLANNTDFGLGVSVFTTDKKLIKNRISQFDDGAVFINDFVKSNPKLPFGGTKTSGLGRELAEEGIKAFTNTKTVVIK